MSFRIDGPAVISFSGGRTSGYMLRRCLDEGLSPDTHVVFANTGKEREETLEFVRDCATHWSVNIRWVERPKGGDFREVTFETASRNGEPFAQLCRERGYLPNPVTRFCTQELKIRVMRDFMRSLGHGDDGWTNVVGIRADEPRRAARILAGGRDKWEVAVPLYHAGTTKADVLAFWDRQPFDLRLEPWEGNCDLCFLKGLAKKERIIRDRPELARWWQEMEMESRASKPSGASFRNDQPSYAQMAYRVAHQPLLPVINEVTGSDDVIDCFCSD